MSRKSRVMKIVTLVLACVLCMSIFTGCGDELSGKHYAEIHMKDKGVITVELDADAAPITVTNFVKLVEAGFYDGLTFHRIIKGSMMQGGDPNGDGTGKAEETIKGEFAANGVKNELKHTRGALSMARARDYDSGSCQFFIVQEDKSGWDGQYAVFGYVIDGMEVVDDICNNTTGQISNGMLPAENQPIIEKIVMVEKEK